MPRHQCEITADFRILPNRDRRFIKLTDGAEGKRYGQMKSSSTSEEARELSNRALLAEYHGSFLDLPFRALLAVIFLVNTLSLVLVTKGVKNVAAF